MTKRLKTEEKFVTSDQPESGEDSFMHKNQIDEVISKFAVGFTNEEKHAIQSIISKYPDAKDGFLQLLQLFSTKISSTDDPLVTPTLPTVDSGALLFEINDVSFLKPRKKLDVKIYSNNIQLVQSGKVETIITNKDCTRLLCVASKKSTNMLLFFTPTATSSTSAKKKKDAKDSTSEDVVVFTVTDTKLDLVNVSSTNDISSCKDSKSKMCKMLQTAILPLNVAFKTIDPKQHAYSFRSTKKEMYVDCHLKTKDGQLYFFDEGLFFGMKQPFMFIPKETISRIAVNSMRHTFDLHIILETEAIVEFSMIDGSEQQNVANWVEWNGINKKKEVKQTQPKQAPQEKVDDDTPVVVATVTRNPSQPLRRSTRNRKEADTVAAPPPMMDDDDEEDDNYDESDSEDSDSDQDVGPERFDEAGEPMKSEPTFGKVVTTTTTSETVEILSSDDENEEKEQEPEQPQEQQQEDVGFFAVMKH